MNDLAPELFGFLEGRQVGVVREIAVAIDQELGRVGSLTGMNRPALPFDAENSLGGPSVEADVFQDREFFRNRPQVLLYLLPPLQALRGEKRLEAEGVLDEIGIASRPVPAMRVPDSAHILFAFEDDIGDAIGAQIVGGADAGDSRADDDYGGIHG